MSDRTPLATSITCLEEFVNSLHDSQVNLQLLEVVACSLKKKIGAHETGRPAVLVVSQGFQIPD